MVFSFTTFLKSPIKASQSFSSSSVYWNGDDRIALVLGIESNYTVIDVIGQNITDTDYYDPGSGWNVAGVEDGTKNHTLVRKPNVTT